MLHRLQRLYFRYAAHHLRLSRSPSNGGLQHAPARSGLRLIGLHIALWPGLLWRIVTVLPLVTTRRDPHSRTLAKRRLGLDSVAPALRLVPVASPPFASVSQRNISCEVAIVLPVHNARDHVMRCLERIADTTDRPWRLVIVEDGSTDPDLRPALADWVAQEPRATLICHDAPRGFAAAVNVALAALKGLRGPVVLLNSDVTLPMTWASRLIAPLLMDGTIASVTPLSNDGELMGAPFACANVALRNTESDVIDADLRACAGDVDLPVLPTGTGFCMALSPHWLIEVPRFDEGFGRGYGEEVDWCQRTRALGGRHVCQTGLFVGHVGAASFGAHQRLALRTASAPVLAKRWPRFDAEVQAILEHDPLVTARLHVGLVWAKARLKGRPIPLYLAHSLGGGTARWLEQRLARHEVALVLRVGGPLRWQLELHSAGNVTRGATDDFAEITALLAHTGPRRVTYVCAVGDPAPQEIPARLCDLCAEGQGLEVQFHDYFPLNRDYTFRSEPDPAWSALWRPVLQRADHLTVFSNASALIVTAQVPGLAHKLRVTPHAPLAAVPRLRGAPLGACAVIGVPGNLNTHKGAEVVAHLARVFARSAEARLVVLGEVAPDVTLPRSVTVLGGYALSDLPDLVAQHGIGAWLVPSLWPETFSYVTQESLATGLPTLGFDLGGQGEALHAHPGGRVVALHDDGTWESGALLKALRGLPDWPKLPIETDSVSPRNRRFYKVGA